MAKHETWEVKQRCHGVYSVESMDGVTITTVEGYRAEEDARLIAMAPELLEMCELAMSIKGVPDVMVRKLEAVIKRATVST